MLRPLFPNACSLHLASCFLTPSSCASFPRLPPVSASLPHSLLPFHYAPSYFFFTPAPFLRACLPMPALPFWPPSLFIRVRPRVSLPLCFLSLASWHLPLFFFSRRFALPPRPSARLSLSSRLPFSTLLSFLQPCSPRSLPPVFPPALLRACAPAFPDGLPLPLFLFARASFL